LSEAQARQFLQEAERTGGVDVLAAPKVTTLSGRQAQIQVVDFQSIVTGIHPAALVPPDASTPSLTNAFITEAVPVGPTLDVIPRVADDLTTVELTAIATIQEFIGYEDADESSYRRVWLDGEQRAVNLQAPRFRIRRLVAKVRVYDGQTLVLSQPEVTEEVRQTESGTMVFSSAEEPGKKLIVLVSAVVVDPAGNPIRAAEQLP
jgi:type II secretory pathway component GspD/PulD (secretin)